MYTIERVECLIHGGARGADNIAGEFGDFLQIPVHIYHAKWDDYGPAAGSIRNQQMIDEGRPTHALAFHKENSPGTKDMISRLKENKIPVTVIEI